jgi:hypothetical protein
MFRHYHITAQPAGVSKRVRRLVMASKEAPNLKSMSDISDYLGGGQSDSEGEDAGARVTLAQDVGRANSARTQSSLKLHELGPRMALELVKLEEGVCTGQVCCPATHFLEEEKRLTSGLAESCIPLRYLTGPTKRSVVLFRCCTTSMWRRRRRRWRRWCRARRARRS